MRMRTIHDTAKILRKEEPDCALGENALRAMAKAGKIPCVKVGERKILINVDALKAFLSESDTPSKRND